MKKILLSFTSLLIYATSLFSAEYRAGYIVNIDKLDTISTDLFAAPRYLNVNGYIHGDIYAGCQIVTITGEVKDDVHAFCQELRIEGKVGDGVIGWAETIIIDGEVTGDVIAFGGTVILKERSNLKGNLFVGCGEFRFEGGYVGGKIEGGCSKVYLNGNVEKSVDIGVEEIIFGTKFYAKDGIKLNLEKELNKEDIEHCPDNLEITIEKSSPFFKSPIFYWYSISLFIVGLIIILLFKNLSRDYITFAEQNTIKKLGFGLLLTIIVPVVSILLIALILTLPFGLITLCIYFILFYLSSIFSALFIGSQIANRIFKEPNKKSLILPLLIGLIFVLTLTELPLIGWFIFIMIVGFGSGSLVSFIWQMRKAH